jgi:hypothetical protein
MKDSVIIPYVYSNSLQIILISDDFLNLNSLRILISIDIVHSCYFIPDSSLEIPCELSSMEVYLNRIKPISGLDCIYLFQFLNDLNKLF